MVLLKAEVEQKIGEFTDEIFTDIVKRLEQQAAEGAIEAPNQPIQFSYDTRLLLPAMLALGRVHIIANDVPLVRWWRPVDLALLERGRRTTFEIIQALLDGDMRDAINDAEYEDFETNAAPIRRVAAIAQKQLEENVIAWLSRDETPERVGTHYQHAVEISERHQEEDAVYRELLGRLQSASEHRGKIVEEFESTYKYTDPPVAPLFEAEHDLPYFSTQYERVGIIYQDMLNMYEAALDHALGEDFKRSIVLMVIAAQIGLDDTDDFNVDRGDQLTPVTAELELYGRDGIDEIRSIVWTYLDRASRYSNDHLSGMAIAYIREQAMGRIDDLGGALRRE